MYRFESPLNRDEVRCELDISYRMKIAREPGNVV